MDTLEIGAEELAKWQQLVDLLARLADVPAALIMRATAAEIEVFVSSASSENPYHPGDREHLVGSGLYCEDVITRRDRLLVPDARADERWRDNPDIKLGMIAYLGFPLLLPSGEPFGTLCVLDRRENAHGPEIEQLMLRFRDLLESHLALVLQNSLLEQRARELEARVEEIRTLRGLLPICVHCKKIRDEGGYWRSVESYLSKHTAAEFTHSVCQQCLEQHYPR